MLDQLSSSFNEINLFLNKSTTYDVSGKKKVINFALMTHLNLCMLFSSEIVIVHEAVKELWWVR